jgi:hypothetical protein
VSVALKEYEIIVHHDGEGFFTKYTEDDPKAAWAAFRREVNLVVENDYDEDMRVELMGTAIRSTYEEWVLLAEFSKPIVPEEG